MKNKKTGKTCPLCQDPSGTGSYEKTYYPKKTYMGGYIGTWLSKNYRLTGNRLTITVYAMNQTPSDIYYDEDNFADPSISMKFAVLYCPLCRRKLETKTRIK
jgi:hypothetical protein